MDVCLHNPELLAVIKLYNPLRKMYTQKLIKKLWQAKCVFLSALSETHEKKT